MKKINQAINEYNDSINKLIDLFKSLQKIIIFDSPVYMMCTLKDKKNKPKKQPVLLAIKYKQ